MDALVRAHIQKVTDALLSGGSYDGSALDTLSEEHVKLQTTHVQLQHDHEALQRKYDTKLVGLEAANKWLVDQLMEIAGKNNGLTEQLKEKNLAIAELQATVETQQKQIVDSAAKVDDIYFNAFRMGSDLRWAGGDYGRALDMLYQRLTGSIAETSEAAGAPSHSVE